MRSQRVADISIPETGDCGSGYLLTEKLALTSGHVVGFQSNGNRCAVRPIGHDRAFEANIAWVSEKPDVALVMLTEAVDVDLEEAPMFGRPAVRGSLEEYQCVSLGFPSANAISVDEWIEKPIRGTAFELSSGDFDVRVPDLKPDEPDGWSGLSGAALFSRGLLFAIFDSVPPGWDGRSLYATAVWQLLDDPEFRSVLKAGGMRDPVLRSLGHSRYYRTISEKMVNQYFLLDRETHATALETAVANGRQAFLVEGRTKDRFDFLMQRFADESCLKTLLGDKKAAITMLHWPRSFDVDPEAEFWKLRDNWAGILGLAGDESSTARHFADGIGPRRVGIWWRFNLDRMGRGHARLLRMWTDFCLEIQELEGGLYWFACREEGDPQPQLSTSFARPRGPDPEVRSVIEDLVGRELLHVFDPLPPIRADEDIEDWIKRVSLLNEFEREDVTAELKIRLGVLEEPLDDFRLSVEGALGRLDF